jgi:cell pole-organizing protein PopZ
MVSEAGQLAQTEQPCGGSTVEGLVTELIRPILKTWLDDNLPALAERLVRA